MLSPREQNHGIKPLQESASLDEISHLWFETMRLFQIILVNNLIPTWRLIHPAVLKYSSSWPQLYRGLRNL
jgi:hypothetical protein